MVYWCSSGGGLSTPTSGDISPLSHPGEGGGLEQLHHYDIELVVHDVPSGSRKRSLSPYLGEFSELELNDEEIPPNTRSLRLSKKVKQNDYPWLDESLCVEHVYQFGVNET